MAPPCAWSHTVAFSFTRYNYVNLRCMLPCVCTQFCPIIWISLPEYINSVFGRQIWITKISGAGKYFSNMYLFSQCKAKILLILCHVVLMKGKGILVLWVHLEHYMCLIFYRFISFVQDFVYHPWYACYFFPSYFLRNNSFLYQVRCTAISHRRSLKSFW